METKKGAGREGVQPDTRGIWQSADRSRALFRPTRKGMVIRALWHVETLKRGINPVFRASPPTASRITMSRSS
jgi:hypothetical protein